MKITICILLIVAAFIVGAIIGFVLCLFLSPDEKMIV